MILLTSDDKDIEEFFRDFFIRKILILLALTPPKKLMSQLKAR